MKKKIIGLITAAAMLVSSVSALAESEAVRLAQDSNVLTEEAVDSSIVGDEEETALGDENVQPEEAVVSSEEEETVSNEIPDEEEETFNDDVLLPDNTQQPLSLSGMYDASYDINNTILTPEEQKREAEFEAKLRAEMAEEEMNGETAELADSIPTYNQFLADNIYENGQGRRYSLYKNDFSTPYRAYVQKYKSDPTWQSLLGAWRIATFSLSDITSYSNKEVAYYETILFDMLYQGNDVSSLTGELKKAANSIEISTLSKVAKLENETTFDFIKKNVFALSDEERDSMWKYMNQCEEIKDVCGTLGDISEIISYANDMENLFAKVAKASVINKYNTETAKILIKMKDNTNDACMKLALTNMISICSNQATQESILGIITSEYAVGKLLDASLKTMWKGILSHLGQVGMAIEAGQAVGKMLTNALFSTQQDVEMYYDCCALYKFEDVLKNVLSSYESSYKSSHTDENSGNFMRCYKMLLQTHLLGVKESQNYVDSLYKNGYLNELLLALPFLSREGEYNTYTKKLETMKDGIETTLSFLDTDAYNLYLDTYYADDMTAVNIAKEESKYSNEQQIEFFNNVENSSKELGDITITKDTQLTGDIHTYGNVYVQGGTLDLNGHKLEVEGDFIISGKISKDNEGNDVYSTCSGKLKMVNENDYLVVHNDFITYGASEQDNNYVGNSLLSAGTMEIGGNFEQHLRSSNNYYNFYTGGTHKVIFNGADEQEIYFESPHYSGFTQAEFKNDKIKITNRIKGFDLTTDLNLLSEKLDIEGTLNLNGHTLNIKNNLYQTGGTLEIGGGKLNVDKSYYIAGVTEQKDNGNIVYNYSSTSAWLKMVNDSDYVKIKGDFVTYGASEQDNSYAGNSLLSAGTMEIGGNFKQHLRSSNNYYNFYTGGTHKVIFNGTDEQEIYFESPSSSGFTQAEFKNDKIKITNGIKGFDLTTDLNLLSEKLEIEGILNLNGHTLNIKNNLYQTGGTLEIGGGKLNVDKSYYIAGVTEQKDNGNIVYNYSSTSAWLKMVNDSDYVKIKGDFVTYGASEQDNSYVGNSLLSAGTMEIGGNFEQHLRSSNNYYNFYTGGTHKVIFNGADEQEIYFESPSYSRFTNLIISNKNSVNFSTAVTVSEAIRQPGGAAVVNGSNVTLGDKAAFEDHGELNPAINSFVYNASNVIPTWKDYEAYSNNVRPDNPMGELSFEIGSVKQSDGEATVTLTQTGSGSAVLVVVSYDSNGRLAGIGRSDLSMSDGETKSVNVKVNTQNANVSAFVWDSVAAMKPLSEKKKAA